MACAECLPENFSRMDAYKLAINLVKEAREVCDRRNDEYGIDINDVLRVAKFLTGDDLNAYSVVDRP